jgi:predicted TPR repeat methyltransferase
MAMASILDLQRAVTCSRYEPQAYLDLCRALVERGDLDYAADMFGRWAHVDPENPMVAFYRSVLLGGATPDRMPLGCVQHEFDEFAPSFDSVLAQLQYEVPSMLASRLARHLPPDARCRTADLGCGTGLTGLVAKPYSVHLSGVDLSASMLRLAEARGIYDVLAQADLCDFLSGDRDGFDLVVAGDSLVYIGDLAPVFGAIRGAMRDAGLLLFSLEHADLREPFALGVTGRFVHSEAGVRTMLAACGFEVVSLDMEVLRMEGGRGVNGMLVVARAVAGAPAHAAEHRVEG